MTAREEAAIAMSNICDQPPLFREDFLQLVDAIPGDVLVRYAIERGALTPIKAGEYVVGGMTPLYRGVEP